MALQRAHPGARVLATDLDPRAVECSRANGVDSYQGDLFSPLPDDILGAVDLVVAVAPYVPTPDLALLPRDTLGFEDAAHYDGGTDGTDVLHRIVVAAPAFLVRGGTLLLEVGGEQAELLETDLRRAGFTDVDRWYDDDGDLRGIEATLGHASRGSRATRRSGSTGGLKDQRLELRAPFVDDLLRPLPCSRRRHTDLEDLSGVAAPDS